MSVSRSMQRKAERRFRDTHTRMKPPPMPMGVPMQMPEPAPQIPGWDVTQPEVIFDRCPCCEADGMLRRIILVTETCEDPACGYQYMGAPR